MKVMQRQKMGLWVNYAKLYVGAVSWIAQMAFALAQAPNCYVLPVSRYDDWQVENSELYKLLDVPQPRRLFSIKHRVSTGEMGMSLSKLFLISYNRKYFYITFAYTPFDPFYSVRKYYRGSIIKCYDHNGQLVSTIRVFSEGKELIKEELEELYKMDESERKKRQIYSPASIICASSIEDDKLCLLVRVYDGNKNVYKFLVFTPQGKIDKKMSSKFTDMMNKLNKDINNKIIDDIIPDKVSINSRKNNIILFDSGGPDDMVVRISGDGDYSVTKVPFSDNLIASDINPNGNIISIIRNKEKPEELIIRIFKIDKDYKNIDEFKIKIDKKLIQYLDLQQYLDTQPFTNFIVDARGHIFIVFALKETLPKHEWQVSYYKPEHYETPYEHVVAAFPGYIVYEFDPSGQPVGPRALLQTMINLATYTHLRLDEDIDIELHRFTLDNHGNLYYLHYRPDGTEVWMVPRSTR